MFGKELQDTTSRLYSCRNVDEEQALAATFQIRGIPTLAVLRDGKLVGTASSVVQADQLVQALDQVAAADAQAA